ncbi:hypothetical protein GCM10009609_54560 [Pseudonocardia aurantiaca]|uniref:Uncharacterized protein n=1 Tax=Pseudonocardia aurantiaca TaxID=75290 RepID=A0ABW4FKH4_9PSEU
MTVLATVAVEISSVVTHLLRYPTGLRCPGMTANLADRTGGSVEPIVLLPGLADKLRNERATGSLLNSATGGRRWGVEHQHQLARACPTDLHSRRPHPGRPLRQRRIARIGPISADPQETPVRTEALRLTGTAESG